MRRAAKAKQTSGDSFVPAPLPNTGSGRRGTYHGLYTPQQAAIRRQRGQTNSTSGGTGQLEDALVAVALAPAPAPTVAAAPLPPAVEAANDRRPRPEGSHNVATATAPLPSTPRTIPQLALKAAVLRATGLSTPRAAAMSRGSARFASAGSELLSVIRARTPLTGKRSSRYSLLSEPTIGGNAEDGDSTATLASPTSGVAADAAKQWRALAMSLGVGGDTAGAARLSAEEVDALVAEHTAALMAEADRIVRAAKREWELQSVAAAAKHEDDRHEWKQQLSGQRLKLTKQLHTLADLAEEKLERAGADVEEAEMRIRELERQLVERDRVVLERSREAVIAGRRGKRMRVEFHFWAWNSVVHTGRRGRVRECVSAALSRWELAFLDRYRRGFRAIAFVGTNRARVLMKWRTQRDLLVEKCVAVKIAELVAVKDRMKRLGARLLRSTEVMFFELWRNNARHLARMRRLSERWALLMMGPTPVIIFHEWRNVAIAGRRSAASRDDALRAGTFRAWEEWTAERYALKDRVKKSIRAQIRSREVGVRFALQRGLTALRMFAPRPAVGNDEGEVEWWVALGIARGDAVLDSTRGSGIVVAVNPEDEEMVRDGMVHVEFASTFETVQCAEELWGKFTTHTSSAWWTRRWNGGVAVGVKIEHCKLGAGVIVAVSPNDNGRVHIEFESGDLHRYNEQSFAKIQRYHWAEIRRNALAAPFFKRFHKRRIAAAFSAMQRQRREPSPRPPPPQVRVPPPRSGPHMPYPYPQPYAREEAEIGYSFHHSFEDERLLRNARQAERERSSRRGGGALETQMSRNSYLDTVRQLHTLGCGATLRNLARAYDGQAFGQMAAATSPAQQQFQPPPPK